MTSRPAIIANNAAPVGAEAFGDARVDPGAARLEPHSPSFITLLERTGAGFVGSCTIPGDKM